MKKTLTLLALTAALMPMMPMHAKAETRLISVTGVTIDRDNLSNSTGIFDATKNWQTDKGLCWAAACSNLVTWWQNQQDQDRLPSNVPTDNQAIWDVYRTAFDDNGGFIEQGVKWWFTGDNGDKEIGNYLYPRTETSLEGVGGYYKDKLKGGIVPSADLFNLNPMSYGSVANFSTALVSYINDGYGVGMNWISRGPLGGEVGHAVTIWGVEVNDNNVITRLYVTDSDDRGTGLKAVNVTPVQYKGYTTLGMADNTNYKIEYLTLIHSTFSNEETPPNYLEDNNVILKYEVAGGFTVDEDVKDVGQIRYDIYAATYKFRHLTVDHDITAGSILVQAAEMNLLDVEEGKKLLVKGNVTGQDFEEGIRNTLTKTGTGTLELQGSSESIVLEVMAGDVRNCGKLGDATISNGGILVNEGTAAKLTVKDGSVAEMKRTNINANELAFAECVVENGGILKGSGNFGKVVLQEGSTLMVGNSPGLQVYSGESSLSVYSANLVYSIDDAVSYSKYATADNNGWGSKTYSTINMSNRSLTLVNPEFTFALGENILERGANTSDLLSMVGQTFTLKLDLQLFTTLVEAGDKDFISMVAGYGVDNTHFILSEDDAELVEKGLVAEFTPQNLKYYINGQEMYMETTLNVTLAKAPTVPEPTTSTLSLLALASLCARRRRK